jgi:hypothetical protein
MRIGHGNLWRRWGGILMAAHAQSLFDALHAAGLTVTPKPNGGLNVAPSRLLTEELRELVRSGKEDMLRWFAMKAANEFPEPAEPATWEELAAAYYRHHFTCKTCIAAGQGYGLRCGVGASLWRRYFE